MPGPSQSSLCIQQYRNPFPRVEVVKHVAPFGMRPYTVESSSRISPFVCALFRRTLKASLPGPNLELVARAAP